MSRFAVVDKFGLKGYATELVIGSIITGIGAGVLFFGVLTVLGGMPYTGLLVVGTGLLVVVVGYRSVKQAEERYPGISEILEDLEMSYEEYLEQ